MKSWLFIVGAVSLGFVEPQRCLAQPEATEAVLSVRVPDHAEVYINGLATTSSGSQRRYVSPGLKPGYKYRYEVRVVGTRAGRTVEESKTVYLQAGPFLGRADAFLFPRSSRRTRRA